MNLFDEHERYVRKNASLAQGYKVKKKDQNLESKGASHLETGKEASCFSCKYRRKCKTFDNLRTGGAGGVVSYGGEVDKANFLCDKYELEKKQNNSMNKKQIKSLLKNAKKGFI